MAICFGLGAAAYTYAAMKAFPGPRQADDFTWYWLGARALLAGQNPYGVIHVGGRYALDTPFVYPLTTAIATIPFAAWLNPATAAAFFIGVSSALLAWGITSDGYGRLPLFGSISFLWVCNSGQLSPLIAASALLPVLGWLAPVKPNLGLAAIAYRPSRTAVVGSALFITAAFAVNPHWLGQWLAVRNESSLARSVAGDFPSGATGGKANSDHHHRWAGATACPPSMETPRSAPVTCFGTRAAEYAVLRPATLVARACDNAAEHSLVAAVRASADSR